MSKNFNYCNKCWKSYNMWIKKWRDLIWFITKAWFLHLWKTVKCTGSSFVSVRTICAVRNSIMLINPFTDVHSKLVHLRYRKTVGVQHTLVKFHSTMAKHSFLIFTVYS
jgi:hypothetical protein